MSLFNKFNETNHATSDKLKSFSLYPNPLKSIAFIEYVLEGDIAATLELYDLRGKALKSLNLKPGTINTKLNVEKLRSGMYHFRLVLENEVLFNGKMVIVK